MTPSANTIGVVIGDGIIIPVVERYTRGGIRACMEI